MGRGELAELSVDLIGGLPGQTSAQWRHSLDCAAASVATHVSVYDLQVEAGTAFGRWAEAGKETRPWLTMKEAEAAGFKFVPLAVFPSRLSALEGEYAVQLKAMEDLLDSDFSGGKKGYPHMPALYVRAPVPVAVEHEMKRAKKQLADNGKVSPATLYVTYAEVGDQTAQAWANGGAPDHIFVKESNLRLDLNEC